MKVLVIGKGGREHALVWKLAQSPRVEKVYCAPGNAGTALEGENVPIDVDEFDKLVRFVKRESIGLTVVGPEDPLAAGIVDRFRKERLRIFGPSKAAARIEGSKVFAKTLMRNADVPTAEFKIFDHPDPAKYWVESREYPEVIKADGLAAGKGVLVCNDGAEARKAIERVMIREEFGAKAGRQIVVEKPPRRRRTQRASPRQRPGGFCCCRRRNRLYKAALGRRSRAKHRRHGARIAPRQKARLN